MKAKEVEWFVNEIVRLNSLLKKEKVIDENREESYKNIKQNYLELEKQYNNLKMIYEATLEEYTKLQQKSE